MDWEEMIGALSRTAFEDGKGAGKYESSGEPQDNFAILKHDAAHRRVCSLVAALLKACEVSEKALAEVHEKETKALCCVRAARAEAKGEESNVDMGVWSRVLRFEVPGVYYPKGVDEPGDIHVSASDPGTDGAAIVLEFDGGRISIDAQWWRSIVRVMGCALGDTRLEE